MKNRSFNYAVKYFIALTIAAIFAFIFNEANALTIKADYIKPNNPLGTAVDITPGVSVNGGPIVDAVLDEDDMVSDSASAVPTQQSVKAYVDSSASDKVVGPGPTTTDNCLAAFDGTGGYTIKGVPVCVDASGNVTGVGNLTASGDIQGNTVEATTSVKAGDILIQGETITSTGNVIVEATGGFGFKDEDDNLNIVGNNNPSLGNRMIYPSFEEALPPSGAACENCLVYRSNDAALPADIPVIHGNWLLDIDYSTSGYFYYDLADASYDGTPIAISCWARSDAGAWFILRRNGVDNDSMKYQITDQWRLYEFAVTGSSTSNGFKVQSDAGHVYLDDCSIGTQVRATAYGKLQYSNYIEIDLATHPNRGDFSGGTLLVTRLGNNVILDASPNSLAHSNMSNPISGAILPSWATPPNASTMVTTQDSTGAIQRSGVGSDGSINVNAREYDGTSQNRTASTYKITYSVDDGLDGISYVVNTQNPDAPQIGEITFTSSACPAGTLEFGQTVSRTTYADLYSVIGNMFGQGDGSTTFNLPPKGYGIRVAALGSAADPDRASRVACATGGNTGDTVGSCQNDQANSLYQVQSANSTGTKRTVTLNDNGAWTSYILGGDEESGQSDVSHRFRKSGDETRMKNIAFRGCIRYRRATVLANMQYTNCDGFFTTEKQCGWDDTQDKPIFKRCHRVATKIEATGVLANWNLPPVTPLNMINYFSDYYYFQRTSNSAGTDAAAVFFDKSEGDLMASILGSYFIGAGTQVCMEYTYD